MKDAHRQSGALICDCAAGAYARLSCVPIMGALVSTDCTPARLIECACMPLSESAVPPNLLTSRARPHKRRISVSVVSSDAETLCPAAFPQRVRVKRRAMPVGHSAASMHAQHIHSNSNELCVRVRVCVCVLQLFRHFRARKLLRHAYVRYRQR